MTIDRDAIAAALRYMKSGDPAFVIDAEEWLKHQTCLFDAVPVLLTDNERLTNEVVAAESERDTLLGRIAQTSPYHTYVDESECFFCGACLHNRDDVEHRTTCLWRQAHERLGRRVPHPYDDEEHDHA
jgi:hypothetical protein